MRIQSGIVEERAASAYCLPGGAGEGAGCFRCFPWSPLCIQRAGPFLMVSDTSSSTEPGALPARRVCMARERPGVFLWVPIPLPSPMTSKRSLRCSKAPEESVLFQNLPGWIVLVQGRRLVSLWSSQSCHIAN